MKFKKTIDLKLNNLPNGELNTMGAILVLLDKILDELKK